MGVRIPHAPRLPPRVALLFTILRHASQLPLRSATMFRDIEILRTNGRPTYGEREGESEGGRESGERRGGGEVN